MISAFSRQMKAANVLRQCRRNNGYVVLVPEIGEDLPDTDPHLRSDGLPEFSNVTIERCIATIGKQALDVEKTVQKCEKLLSSEPAETVDLFKDILMPIQESESQLEITWGLAKCLYLGNSTRMPTKCYQQINDRARKARYNKFNAPRLYAAVREALETQSDQITDEQQRLLQKYEREGRLNGVALTDNERAILYQTTAKLRQQREKFQANVEAANRKFAHTIMDYKLVRDFPTDLLHSLASDVGNPNEGPWTVNLAPNTYTRFMEHCSDRTLRWNLWQANTRKCSSYSDKQLVNSVHLEEIRGLRHRQAQLLGFETFADMSMATKMVGSVQEVRDMLDGLLSIARPAQECELAVLQAFSEARGHLAGAPLEQWDIPYWHRKLQRSQHQYDEDTIREYFPLPRVLQGAFALFSELFGLRIEPRESAGAWHADVQFYDVYEGNDLQPTAGFYLDLYARDSDKLRQRQGNMVAIRQRNAHIPLSALVFDFAVPQYGKPSLLSYTDVRALFARFGHALQHMLTRVHHNDLAGMANIEWDAIGISSNVLANFVRDDRVLNRISGHYASGEPLPDELRAALCLSDRAMAGYSLSQELYTARLDIELHTQQTFWLDIVRDLWPRYHALPFDKRDAHPCSMTDIVSGNWAAAYFGHVWSRVVAADVCDAFEEAYASDTGNADIGAVGRRYRDTFLALGGARHASEVFRQFRGRDPSARALLRQLGLTPAGTHNVPHSDEILGPRPTTSA